MVNYSKNNWIVLTTLLIALVGGIPGIVTIVKFLEERPTFIVTCQFRIVGEMVQSDKHYPTLCLPLTIANRSEIPLSPAMFNCFVRHKNKWIHLENVLIPENLIFHSKEQAMDIRDPYKADLQKFKGSIERDKPQYGYLMFRSTALDIDTLHSVKTIKLACQDVYNKKYKAVLNFTGPSKFIKGEPIVFPKHGVILKSK